MLDLVIGGAKDLRRTLPQVDQYKLDEYLDSIRAVERQIAAIKYRQKKRPWRRPEPAPESVTKQTRQRSKLRFPLGTSKVITYR
ncbi:MAG: DUF1552 domain-containing protein [Verrucomicrobiales bacterium]